MTASATPNQTLQRLRVAAPASAAAFVARFRRSRAVPPLSPATAGWRAWGVLPHYGSHQRPNL